MAQEVSAGGSNHSFILRPYLTVAPRLLELFGRVRDPKPASGVSSRQVFGWLHNSEGHVWAEVLIPGVDFIHFSSSNITRVCQSSAGVPPSVGLSVTERVTGLNPFRLMFAV